LWSFFWDFISLTGNHDMMKNNEIANVSIVTASHNSGKYLFKTIESVAAQTIKPRQHIIVDDCSSDDSVAIAKGCSNRFPWVKVILHTTNRGFPAALNSGIEAAEGEFIGVLDSDDIANPNWLETVVPILVNDPDVGSVGGGCVFMSEDGLLTGQVEYCSLSGDVTNNARRGQYPFLHPGTVHRRSTLKSIGGYNGRIKSAEDMDLFLSISYVSKLINVGRPLIQYRKRRLSESRKTPEYNAAIADFLKAKGNLLKSGKSVAEANQILDEEINSLARMPRIRKLAPYEYDFEMAKSFEVGKHHWHALRYYFSALRSGHSPRIALRGVLRCLRDAGLKWSNPFQANRPSFR
jgi:glycosyltransferase involved in cell wall biosynthesis